MVRRALYLWSAETDGVCLGVRGGVDSVLVLSDGGCEYGVVIQVGARVTLGKPLRGADIEVTSQFMSAQHTELVNDDDGWTARDLGSSNGTRVNGMLIGRETATPLSVGDQIRFGDKTFVVRDAPRESPANR